MKKFKIHKSVSLKVVKLKTKIRLISNKRNRMLVRGGHPVVYMSLMFILGKQKYSAIIFFHNRIQSNFNLFGRARAQT